MSTPARPSPRTARTSPRTALLRRPWMLGGIIGFGLVILFYIALIASSAIDFDDGVAFGIAAIVLVALIVGAVPGVLVGSIVTVLRRSSSQAPKWTGNADDGWSVRGRSIDDAVTRFHVVAGAVADPSVQLWLQQIGTQLDGEAAEARQLIDLGRELAPGTGPAGPTDPEVRALWDRVLAAEAAFSSVTSQALSIRVSLADEPDLTEVRVQLDALREQLPNLRSS